MSLVKYQLFHLCWHPSLWNCALFLELGGGVGAVLETLAGWHFDFITGDRAGARFSNSRQWVAPKTWIHQIAIYIYRDDQHWPYSSGDPIGWYQKFFLALCLHHSAHSPIGEPMHCLKFNCGNRKIRRRRNHRCWILQWWSVRWDQGSRWNCLPKIKSKHSSRFPLLHYSLGVEFDNPPPFTSPFSITESGVIRRGALGGVAITGASLILAFPKLA